MRTLLRPRPRGWRGHGDICTAVLGLALSGLHFPDTNPVTLFLLSLPKLASPTLLPTLALPVLLQPIHGEAEDHPRPGYLGSPELGTAPVISRVSRRPPLPWPPQAEPCSPACTRGIPGEPLGSPFLRVAVSLAVWPQEGRGRETQVERLWGPSFSEATTLGAALT